MLTDAQLLTIALATGPTVFAVLVGILINNSRLSDLRDHMDRQFAEVDRRLEEMRDLWRSELRRVGEVIDARLKSLESR